MPRSGPVKKAALLSAAWYRPIFAPPSRSGLKPRDIPASVPQMN
jgi:hypothetical protein